MNQQGLTPAPVKSHAYILWGGGEEERADAALRLAAAVLCSGGGPRPCLACVHCTKAFRHIHPDIIELDRSADTRAIYVDQIRALREDAVVLPNDADNKVYVIHHADSMNASAQNALLKLLEEPPSFVTMILVSENPAALLATVRSRCVELPAGRELPDLSGARDTVDAFYGALGDALALVSFSFKLEKLDRNSFGDFLDGARAFLTERLKDAYTGGRPAQRPEYLMQAVAVLGRAAGYLNANVGLGHIAGMICAELSAPNDTEGRAFPPPLK